MSYVVNVGKTFAEAKFKLNNYSPSTPVSYHLLICFLHYIHLCY